MTNLGDLIYVLCLHVSQINVMDLRAYEGSNPHDLLLITVLPEEVNYWNSVIVGLENTNTIYINDAGCRCIWQIGMNNNRIDKWMSYEDFRETSVSASYNNEQVVLLRRHDDYLLYLEIYDEDKTLVRKLSLPEHFRFPFHVTQKPNGDFIVSHSLRTYGGRMFASIVSVDGQIISQFILTDERSVEPVKMVMDTDNSILILVQKSDGYKHLFDLIAFDLKPVDRCWYPHPMALLYDRKKRQFIYIRKEKVRLTERMDVSFFFGL